MVEPTRECKFMFTNNRIMQIIAECLHPEFKRLVFYTYAVALEKFTLASV